MKSPSILNTIIDSPLWTEPFHVRILFITMLALKGSDNVVRATTFQLQRRSGLNQYDLADGIRDLAEKDPELNGDDGFDGRYIEKVDGGWRILNGDYFSCIIQSERRREYQREKQMEYRLEKCDDGQLAAQDLEIYNIYPRKVGKPDALRKIRSAIGKFGFEFLKAKTILFANSRINEDEKFTPHPATWFNQERFNDPVAQQPGSNIGGDLSSVVEGPGAKPINGF